MSHGDKKCGAFLPGADPARCVWCGVKAEEHDLSVVPSRAEPDNYVAWLRFDDHNGERPTSIHLCDSDHPKAFKVYRAPLSSSTETDNWRHIDSDEGKNPPRDTPCDIRLPDGSELHGAIRGQYCWQWAQNEFFDSAIAAWRLAE